MSLRPLAVLLTVALCGAACRRPAPAPSRDVTSPAASVPLAAPAAPSPFSVAWTPADGKGAIVQQVPGEGRYEICLGCRYKGYAGGTWLGSMNGSGFSWTPPAPVRGFRSLNLFCAQDESLWDEDEGRELDNGWSQNFGKGPDGVRLEYQGGQVLDDGGTGQGVTLRSVNAAGCWQETRYLWWPQGVAHVLVALHLTNTCDAPRRFSFWTGEDPWIGLYRSSDGDVGWYSGGIVRTEARVEGRDFRWGGLYDLGNEVLGQTAAAFSNVADVLVLEPGGEAPDVAYFANSFAHDDHDIDPARPLDNQTLTAFNLGWKGRTLAPGATFTLRYALGRAETGEPGTLPRPPQIPPEAWAFDRVYEQAFHAVLGGRPGTEGGASTLPVRFHDEVIDVTVEPGRVTVDALYGLQNPTRASAGVTLLYPIPVDDAHPFPDRVEVKDRRFGTRPDGLLIPVSLGPGEETTLAVRYSQAAAEPVARYILTSTGAWGRPLRSGTYRVRWPADLPGVRVSYPGHDHRAADGWITRSFERTDFQPDRDLVVTWAPSPPPGPTTTPP